MSRIEIVLNNDVLNIERKTSRQVEYNIENIQVNLLEYGREYKSKLRVTNKNEKNKILFLKEISKLGNNQEIEDNNFKEKNNECKNVIFVYTQNEVIKYSFCSLNEAYKRILKLKFKILDLKLNKKFLKVKILAYLVNQCSLNINNIDFYIDDELYKTCNLKQYNRNISKFKMLCDKNIYTFKFNMQDILKDESTINGAIKFLINIDGNDIEYRVGIKDKNIKNIQHYYAPIRSVFVKDFAVHIRRTIKGNLTLVKRKLEPIEKNLKFKILESKFISMLFYNISKLMLKIRSKKINLFYEKFASKAEEGTYDLFLMMQQKNKNTKNYFIISKDSEDYERIKENKGVVKKYSTKYYWLIYNANNFISTEAPIHLNILRSNNPYLRKCLMDKPFIFLQHGVTYMKCQGKNSTFSKNKEGQVSYIVAGSEKEKDVIVDMLGIDDEQVIKTGLPIFSKIKYNHIKQESEDYITVMLTWKPYEEQLYDFEKSSYYQNVLQICNMLKKYIEKEKIIIIAHPKAEELLSSTDLKESLWKEPISKALEKTKLLITDYSSVCYNSFYQGAGVIFYQPDLELYENENGKLIPNDNEYIGKRTFDINELEEYIRGVIQNKEIILDKCRTKEFEKNYKLINEFSDGKNIERIYNELIKLNIV